MTSPDSGHSQPEQPGGSFPPPRSNPPAPPAGAGYAPGGSQADDALRRAPTVEQAEALARVAALAARERSDGGPSRALVATVVALGVLVVALLLLGLIVATGPDPGASP
jgi:hypothetical protein